MQFHNIAIIGQPQKITGHNDTIQRLYDYLKSLGLNAYVESYTAAAIEFQGDGSMTMEQLAEICDLAVVVGGDGSVIGAARPLAFANIPIIGINRGHLGFLSDLSKNSFEEPLLEILNGKYHAEHRSCLRTEKIHKGKVIERSIALNEVVLSSTITAHMINFTVLFDGHFVYSLNADGLIISTPTGSTAYNLSAGGPIIAPELEAMCLTPMFPHSLTCRPIVVDGDHVITITLNRSDHCQISCDGQIKTDVSQGDELQVHMDRSIITILHPYTYDYFRVLREKLGWGGQLI